MLFILKIPSQPPQLVSFSLHKIITNHTLDERHLIEKYDGLVTNSEIYYHINIGPHMHKKKSPINFPSYFTYSHLHQSTTTWIKNIYTLFNNSYNYATSLVNTSHFQRFVWMLIKSRFSNQGFIQFE